MSYRPFDRPMGLSINIEFLNTYFYLAYRLVTPRVTNAILMYIAVCVRFSSVDRDSFVLFLATAVLDRVCQEIENTKNQEYVFCS